MSDENLNSPNDNVALQLNEKIAKDDLKMRADTLLLQLDAKKPINPSELDFDNISKIQKQIEQVYRFERDVATAKVQDPAFEQTVGKINNYMGDFRKNYKDSEYLRDPIADDYAAAERRNADKARRNFEATKQALDLQKTKYEIRQSEAVAKAAGASK